DRAANRLARLRLRHAAQVAQVAADDVEVFHAAPAADIGGLVDEAAAENALHRAHQPAVDPIDIGRDGSTPEYARRLVRMDAVGEVENSGRHRAVAGLELDQAHLCARRRNGDRRVGGAEVDRAVHGRQAWAGARL